jgi:predicted aspartyl protease
MLSEDILNALEMHSASTEEDCFLSLNAIVGTQNNKVIHLVVLVNNQVISILVDSGSSHTFLNESMLLRLACKVTTVPKMIVKVANGDIVFSDREVKDFHWWIQGHTFKVDAKILDLAAYDLILGMDWLEQHRPMTCD